MLLYTGESGETGVMLIAVDQYNVSVCSSVPSDTTHAAAAAVAITAAGSEPQPAARFVFWGGFECIGKACSFKIVDLFSASSLSLVHHYQ